MIHQPILLFLGVLLFMFGMLQPISPEVSPAADIPSSLPSPMVTPTPTPSLSVEALPAIPLQYELDAGSHVFQTFNNCGPASLSMALSYFDVDRSQASLGDVLRPYQHSQGNNDDKSVTLDELEAWAEANGYGAVHRPAGDIELLQRFVAAELPVIVRTWLNPDEDIGHYRVVVGYDREREILIQDDSLQGDDLEYSYSDFNEIWEAFFYEYLVLIPAERAGELEPLLGTISTEMNAWQDALEQATAQLDENPNDLWAQFNRSVALYQLGRFQESIAAFEQVEGRLPSRTLWYQIQPLLAYYRAGEYGEVMTRTEAILENENAAFSELFVLRAAVLRQQGADPAARQALERAARYNESSYWLQNIPQSIREDAAVEDVL
jgi:tetratricopeptide (TPR) repeat protein